MGSTILILKGSHRFKFVIHGSPPLVIFFSNFFSSYHAIRNRNTGHIICGKMQSSLKIFLSFKIVAQSGRLGLRIEESFFPKDFGPNRLLEYHKVEPFSLDINLIAREKRVSDP